MPTEIIAFPDTMRLMRPDLALLLAASARGAFVVRRYASAQRAYYKHLDAKWTQPKPAKRKQTFRTRGNPFKT